MARCSNALIATLNVVTILIALAGMAAGAYFWIRGGSDCERTLQMPLLIGGGVLFVISLCGFVGAVCRSSFLMWVYLFVMFILILAILCFTVFALVVTNKGVGKAISNRGFKEYRIKDYSNWLQQNVVNDKNWVHIKDCLVDSKICRRLGDDVSANATAFFAKDLSPFQSGCCKPPTACGMVFKNATYWEMPKRGAAKAAAAAEDKDCKTWSNDQKVLCYECNSCKAGFLANIKSQWRNLAIANACVFVLLVFIYSVGCCAFRNNRSDKYQKPKGGYA